MAQKQPLSVTVKMALLGNYYVSIFTLYIFYICFFMFGFVAPLENPFLGSGSAVMNEFLFVSLFPAF